MTIISEIKISHNSQLPLHVQLNNQISYFIRTGELEPGTRLPSELELHHDLNISRTTVRHAFRDMEFEGLIERIPGKGTFVAHRSTNKDNHSLNLVLFLASDFNFEFECRLLSGIEQVAKAQGCQVGLVTLRTENNIDVYQYVRQLLSGRKVGVVIWHHIDPVQDTELIRLLSEHRVPAVIIDRTISGIESDYVTSDNYHGAFRATEYLIKLGYHQIVFLSHRYLSILPVAERLRGYREALAAREINVPEPWIIDSTSEILSPQFVIRETADAGSLIVQSMIERLKTASPRPTAIFAVNDYMALVTLCAAKAANIKVPDELAVVGFDDSDFTSHLEIPLTTVAQNTTAIGKRAVELLIERMEGYQGASRWEKIPVELRLRKTTPNSPEFMRNKVRYSQKGGDAAQAD